MHRLKGIVPEGPAHVSVQLWAAYGGGDGTQPCCKGAPRPATAERPLRTDSVSGMAGCSSHWVAQ